MKNAIVLHEVTRTFAFRNAKRNKNMAHAHHHEHSHTVAPQSLNGIFYLSIALNAAFVAVEAGVGFWYNSLGLLSDAGHNLGDVFSLILALVGFKLSKLAATRTFTYGYKKSTVLISLVNALILLVAVGAIGVESVRKLMEPAAVDGEAVSLTAGVGIVVNGFTAWLLMKNQKHDLNVRGAYLHMAADTLVSVGVVLSGLVISYTGWTIIDPLIGLAIAAIILFSTWHLLSESLRLTLDAMPENIDREQIEAMMAEEAHVTGVHHVHVWAISTTEVALTAHVVVDELKEMGAVKHALRHRLHEAGITHCTLEMEVSGETCEAACCSM